MIAIHMIIKLTIIPAFEFSCNRGTLVSKTNQANQANDRDTLVVKTTNLATQTRMNIEVKASYLLIYKGKVFIGSFGCRNDCLAVHSNCQKRRGSGFPLSSSFTPYNRNTSDLMVSGISCQL